MFKQITKIMSLIIWSVTLKGSQRSSLPRLMLDFKHLWDSQVTISSPWVWKIWSPSSLQGKASVIAVRKFKRLFLGVVVWLNVSSNIKVKYIKRTDKRRMASAELSPLWLTPPRVGDMKRCFMIRQWRTGSRGLLIHRRWTQRSHWAQHTRQHTPLDGSHVV